MKAASIDHYLSEHEYLSGEKISQLKHEYIAGEVFAMAGASRNHERIAGNIYAKLLQQLTNIPCEPFSSDLKVKALNNFYYPDVLVVCDDADGNNYYTEKPLIIVEVLSKSTRRMDKTHKMQAYKNIPELQEYVLIEQDYVDVEICRRNNHWQSEHYFLGDEITFKTLELTLTVAEIYQRVQNEDMQLYLEALASKTENLPL